VILDKYGDRQGWDDASKLAIALEYIDNQQDEDAFDQFVAEKADDENTI